MKKLLPLVLALIGTGIGAGAGIFLKAPEPESTAEATCPEPEKTVLQEVSEAERSFVRLNNQFVVPLVEHNRVNAMIVLSLSLEADGGVSESIFGIEPKLRDAFLQVLFDHANMGGFEGNFTSADAMDILRRSLLNTAQSLIGPSIYSVLVTDIARQEL